MSEIGRTMKDFELHVMMNEYKEKIKKAEDDGDTTLANQLVKESYQKAIELGWRK